MNDSRNIYLKSIILNPIEQRYLASCYPLKDRSWYDEALRWREIFRNYAKSNSNVEIEVISIAKAFPHFARLCIEGFFIDRTVQNYFEGTDEKSHNMRNYLFAKSRKREKLPKEILEEMLEHVEYCSVRPVSLRDRIVFSYGGPREEEIDTEYFGIDLVHESDFAFVHGRSNKGSILIRGVSEEEFKNLVKWFEERQKSKDNPFRKIKNS